MVAACVILPKDFDTPGLDDSKKLTEKRRNAMLEVIRKEAVAYGLGMASPEKIDEVNILEATKGAMKIAIAKAEAMLMKKAGAKIDHILFDAIKIEDIQIPQTSSSLYISKFISFKTSCFPKFLTRLHTLITERRQSV